MWPRTEPRTLESGGRQSQPPTIFVTHSNFTGYVKIAVPRRAVSTHSWAIIKMRGDEGSRADLRKRGRLTVLFSIELACFYAQICAKHIVYGNTKRMDRCRRLGGTPAGVRYDRQPM